MNKVAVQIVDLLSGGKVGQFFFFIMRKFKFFRKHKFKDPQNKIGNLYSAVTSHVHQIIIRNHLCSYGATTYRVLSIQTVIIKICFI